MHDTNEDARLAALYQLDLLDTPPSEAFDRITRMAGQIFNLPIAAISLTDRDRQWFKSRIGVEHDWIPRKRTPCALVTETADSVLISDMQDDACFADSVLSQQGIRFYAGVPLVTREGFTLGALCVLGVEPRSASPSEMAALTDLAQIAMSQIELQRAHGRIDPISGLPNRLQFFEDLEDLGRKQPGQRRLATLVDLARTDQLNTSVRVMGPDYIDNVVRLAAESLRQRLGPKRRAYHVAATQFVFLAPRGIPDEEYLEMLEGILLQERTASHARFVLTSTMGVAPFVASITEPSHVLRTAHNAAVDARESETLVGFYSWASDTAHQRRFELLNAFGEALDSPDQLRVVFQPRMDLVTGACSGAEVLLRWRHPVLGEISPAEFVPIIEATLLARPLTAWVLDAALAQLSIWHRAGHDLQLSINVSATNLEEADFAQQVQLYLLKHRIKPDRLELEVTESAVMAKGGTALSQLHALEEAQIHLAIDDFGTGYSSLAYLQRLPAQIVKIDQSFIFDLDEDTCEKERTLVRSMITLSHDLGYRVVAEGVETAEVAAILTDMGCDEAQGFLYARPLERGDFEQWLSDQVTRAARHAA